MDNAAQDIYIPIFLCTYGIIIAIILLSQIHLPD